ncbi:MAG: 4-(cytidine 5'-diphospho)-2-C-methyl-D-erythritol kinase [Bacteroidales bacterium]|nr:4-(cytidine 5'-diphospho)-2-C-methyl-D-erythritol kinase [Bacteroidales bacterium]
MISFPNAKINIGLRVIRKLPSGYHEIESILYPLGLTDVLEIVPGGKKVNLLLSGVPVHGKQEDNLCFKAWQLFHEDFGISPVKIHLHKHIPIGAGLGGGSSDGAYALKMLNAIFDLKLEKTALEQYAAMLGSDCPFFISNQPTLVTGTGTQLSTIKMDSLKGFFVAIVKPAFNVRTAEAYAGITPKLPEGALPALINKDIRTWRSVIVNDFEQPIFHKYPAIRKIKERFYDLGAVYAAMSGSGSAVYGIFDRNVKLKRKFPGNFVWQAKL